MKSWADKVLCSESNNEYQHLLAKLGGTRTNLAKRVFHFLGLMLLGELPRLIEAEQKKKMKVATMKATQGGGSPSGCLEKTKRKQGARKAIASKHPRIMEQHLSSSPLQDKGQSPPARLHHASTFSRSHATELQAHSLDSTLTTKVQILPVCSKLNHETT